MPTETHKKAWQDYEYILTIRANIGMYVVLLQNLIWYLLDQTHISKSENYISEEKSKVHT